MGRIRAIAMAICLCAMLPASADVVYTKDGRRLVGEVLRKDGRVIVRMKLGSILLRPEDVLRIEPGKEVSGEFDKRLAALKATDHDGRLKLARWGLESGLRDKALGLFRKLVSVKPEAKAGIVKIVMDDLVGLAKLEITDETSRELGRYPEQVKAWMVDRHGSRSKALAAVLDKEGPPSVDDCVALYREQYRRLSAVVRGSNFGSKSSPATRRRAMSLYLTLSSLYQTDTARPFLRMRHAGRLEEIERLEGLALDLEIPLPAEVPHEDALDKHDRPLERAAIDLKLKIKSRAAVMKAVNAKYPGLADAERKLIDLINRYRDMLGLALLRLESRLCMASEAHTSAMLAHKFFSHDSPLAGRREPKDRVARTGYPWDLVGEVLARRSTKAQAVFDAFLKSPTHHRTLIHRSFREIGIGKSKDYWTLELAVRR